MKTNVQPGMLARVVRSTNQDNIGRIVFVEREHKAQNVYESLEGYRCSWSQLTEPTWVVSAKMPIPYLNTEHSDRPSVLHFHERPMPDSMLRPLLDPNLDISDQEVRELFSTYPLRGELSVKEAFARWCDFVHNR